MLNYHSIIKAIYTSGEDEHKNYHRQKEVDNPWQGLTTEQTRKRIKFFERIEREEKERRIRDANADWNFRRKRQILKAKNPYQELGEGLIGVFIWSRYKTILLLRKLIRP